MQSRVETSASLNSCTLEANWKLAWRIKRCHSFRLFSPNI